MSTHLLHLANRSSAVCQSVVDAASYDRLRSALEPRNHARRTTLMLVAAVSRLLTHRASHLVHPQSNPQFFFNLCIRSPRLSFLSSPLRYVIFSSSPSLMSTPAVKCHARPSRRFSMFGPHEWLK